MRVENWDSKLQKVISDTVNTEKFGWQFNSNLSIKTILLIASLVNIMLPSR